MDYLKVPSPFKADSSAVRTQRMLDEYVNRLPIAPGDLARKIDNYKKKQWVLSVKRSQDAYNAAMDKAMVEKKKQPDAELYVMQAELDANMLCEQMTLKDKQKTQIDIKRAMEREVQRLATGKVIPARPDEPTFNDIFVSEGEEYPVGDVPAKSKQPARATKKPSRKNVPVASDEDPERERSKRKNSGQSPAKSSKTNVADRSRYPKSPTNIPKITVQSPSGKISSGNQPNRQNTSRLPVLTPVAERDPLEVFGEFVPIAELQPPNRKQWGSNQPNSMFNAYGSSINPLPAQNPNLFEPTPQRVLIPPELVAELSQSNQSRIPVPSNRSASYQSGRPSEMSSAGYSTPGFCYCKDRSSRRQKERRERRSRQSSDSSFDRGRYSRSKRNVSKRSSSRYSPEDIVIEIIQPSKDKKAEPAKAEEKGLLTVLSEKATEVASAVSDSATAAVSAASDTTVPETAPSETAASDKPAAETPAPDPAAPDAAKPDAAAPDAAKPDDAAPDAAKPDAAAADAAKPDAAAADAAKPDAAAPEAAATDAAATDAAKPDAAATDAAATDAAAADVTDKSEASSSPAKKADTTRQTTLPTKPGPVPSGSKSSLRKLDRSMNNVIRNIDDLVKMQEVSFNTGWNEAWSAFKKVPEKK